MLRDRNRHGALVCLLSGAVLLSGCNNVVKEQRTTTITSEPSGATVLASGVKIGVTPITVRPDEVFPPRFVGFEYRAAGTLEVNKPGCKAYTQQVDDGVLSKDIHVKLDCDPSYRPAQVEKAPAAASPAPVVDDDFAARLRRLDELHRQKLISDDEYQQLRKKILNQL